MVRISKDPDDRRNELLETADRLFTERGFSSVRVSDIVSEMNVAQGTFYYYFKSKDDILVYLLEQKWIQIAALINNNLTLEIDPFVRLSEALSFMIIPGDEIISNPSYALLSDPAVTGMFHPDFDRARIKSLLPVMTGVIEYGIQKFKFPQMLNTSEVIKIIFLGINAYFHQTNTQYLQSAISPVCELIERVLGLSSGTLKIN
jgi:AcrR family transcriptional regulator